MLNFVIMISLTVAAVRSLHDITSAARLLAVDFAKAYLRDVTAVKCLARQLIAISAVIGAIAGPVTAFAHGWEHAHEAEHRQGGLQAVAHLAAHDDRLSTVEADDEGTEHDALHGAPVATSSKLADYVLGAAVAPAVASLVPADRLRCAPPSGEPRGSPSDGLFASHQSRAPPIG